MTVSILILTRNEAQDLPGCLDSVAWSDDIHVYDSLSDDATVDLARARGAHVTQRAFDDWSSHQNWGLRNIPFRHPWVFYIDADERMTPALAAAVRAATANPGDAVAFRVRRRDFFLGRWLEHVQTTPYYVRLFRPERMRYERLVNPVSIVDGSVAPLAGDLDHFPFSKGMQHWFARHNSYSTLEARQIVDNRRRGETVSLWQAFTARDFTTRRFHQKELFYRLPFRPLAKFLLLYVAKRGFLDGRAGFTYACMQAVYEYMIVLKTRELEERRVSGVIERLYPEIGAGGFSRVDGTVAFYIRINALLRPDASVLDLGAGRGSWTQDDCVYRRELQRLQGRVRRMVGCDVDDAVLAHPALDEAHVVAPGAPLPFADASFDLIVSDWTLEHVESPRQFAAEVARVLRPGGWFCARTPNRWHYVYVASALVPNALHTRILRRAQPWRAHQDIFPTWYRLNSLRDVRRHFAASDFSDFSYHHSASPGYHFNRLWLARTMAAVDRLLPGGMGQTLHVFLRRL